MSAVYKAIATVQGELAKVGIGKNRQNVQQNYAFRGIDDVYSALSPLLSKHGLCVLPRMIDRAMHERVTIKEWNGQRKESVLFYVTVTAEFDFVAVEDGSVHTVRTYGEAMDSGDKATNKAMSAAYKYAAFMTFAIPTEGDNDADATTHDVAPAEPVAGETRTTGPAWPEGPTKTKTAAMTAFRAVKRNGESVTTLDDFEAVIDEAQPLIAQFRLADHPWWYGGSGEDKYESIPEWISRRRADLASVAQVKQQLGDEPVDPLETEFPGSTESFKMMIADMRKAPTPVMLNKWKDNNRELVNSLDKTEVKAFRKAFEDHMETLQRAQKVAA